MNPAYSCPPLRAVRCQDGAPASIAGASSSHAMLSNQRARRKQDDELGGVLQEHRVWGGVRGDEAELLEYGEARAAGDPFAQPQPVVPDRIGACVPVTA